MQMADKGAGRWSLVELLHILRQKHHQSPGQGQRNAAAKQLMDDMEGWAKAVIWKQLGRSVRELPPHEARALVDSAIQALAVAASTANEPFAGSSELAARAWCRRVMLNHVTSELRSRASRTRAGQGVALAVSEASDVEALAAEHPLDDRAALSEVQQQLADLVMSLRAVRRQVRVARRPRDVPSTMKAIWCYLAYLSGATLDEQLFVLDLKGGDGDERRQKNLVYKLRERGRKALRAAYGCEQDE